MKLFKCVITFIIIIEVTVQVEASIPRVVLDIDAGADDAFALGVLLHAEKSALITLEAIVCSRGNSDISNTCTNVVRVLEAVNRTDIPVYKGAFKPIVPLPENMTGLSFYGKDGFGDLALKLPNISIIQDVPASIAIHKLVSSNPKEIIIVSAGPLTTTALTMLLFDDFASKLKEIWIMGGNFGGPGNAGEEAEFNFYNDPESANVVLHNDGCPTIIFTWETCLNVGITIDWRFNVLGKAHNPFINLMNDVEAKVYADKDWKSDWYQCDAFTAIALTYPEIILKKDTVKVRVELHNEKSRGKLFIDKVKKNQMSAVILERIDSDAVKKVLIATVNNL